MFKDLIYLSRSYRSFDPSVVIPKEQLIDFVDCARLSPSSMNLQMLKFRLVTSKTECHALLRHIRLAAKLPKLHLPPTDHEPTACIVICADTSIIETAEKFQKDVGICAQSILLAATESGYGGCMVGSFSASAVSEVLHLPSSLIPQLVLVLGKPDETVELTEPAEDGSVTYYRENGIHYVQKRMLKDLIVE